MSVWGLVHEMVEESDTVKEEYDYLFSRYEKAMAFFENPYVSVEEKDRLKPKFDKMIARMKKLRKKMSESENSDAPEIEELPKDIVEEIDLFPDKISESIPDSLICEQEPVSEEEVPGFIKELDTIMDFNNELDKKINSENDTPDDVVRGATVIEDKDGKIYLVYDPNAIPWKKPLDRPCFNCGGTVLWESKSGNIVCETCHPPPEEEAVERRIQVNVDNLTEISSDF